MDLLTPAEERADQFSGHLRFDIRFLARRVIAVVDEMREQSTRRSGCLARAPVPLRRSSRRPRGPRASGGRLARRPARSRGRCAR